MKLYRKNAKWHVRVEGVGGNPAGPGTPQEMGSFDGKPNPTLWWRTEAQEVAGVTRTDYTQFEVGGQVAFVLAEVDFQPDPGNSAEYGGEELLAPDHERAQPLALTDCQRWTGNGWEPCEAPAILVCRHPDDPDDPDAPKRAWGCIWE